MGKSSVVTISTPQDLRTQVESIGAGSQFISPGATVAAPGSQAGSVGSYSTLNQHFSTSVEGMTGDQVRGLLLDQEAVANENLQRVTQLSTDALKTSTAAVQSIATGSTPEPTDWTRYVPLLIAGGVGLALVLMAGRRAA